MSAISKDRYISPVPIMSRVLEELRFYFDGQAIDPLLFSIWIKDCLDKFENTYVPIMPAVLDICNGKCELPCDFKMVKEVWVAATFNKGPITSPHVFYYQTDCRIDASAPPANNCSECIGGYQCFGPNQTPTQVALPDLCGVPEQYITTHKVMDQLIFSFDVIGMLKPGNFLTFSKLGEDCINRNADCFDTFDIMGNQLLTSFKYGSVFLIYYADPDITDSGFPMIPQNDPFQKYVYRYLRYKVFEQLTDMAAAEEYKLMKDKRTDAEKLMIQEYINARNYAVSGDVYDVMNNIKRTYNLNNRFIIPNDNRY